MSSQNWAYLALNVTSLKIKCELSEYERFWKRLTDNLPLFVNLVQLEISSEIIISNIYTRRMAQRPFLLQLEESNREETIVEFKNLEHLKIDHILLMLQDRYIKFSPNKLKTLELEKCCYGVRISSLDITNIVEIVELQKSLECLKLSNDFVQIFSQPLNLESQLKEFHLSMEKRAYLNVQFQDNLVDFLESQKRICALKYQFRGPKTQKMLNYQMKSL